MKKVTSILMVDDDLDDRVLFRDALDVIDPSLKVVFAENGIDALEKIQAGDSMPDIIFSDINMPLMNGMELLEKMKEDVLLSSIPVIMYTTSPAENYKSKCKQLGVQHYIVKPNHFYMICAEIRTALQIAIGLQFKLDTEV